MTREIISETEEILKIKDYFVDCCTNRKSR